MQTNLKLLVLIGIIAGWTACDDEDTWVMGDVPGKGQTAIYSNKLSAPVGGNDLILHYSDSLLIGKEVRFGLDEQHKGTLTLEGILPGEWQTAVTGMALKDIAGGYAFSGTATGETGVAFRYTGQVVRKKLTLDLSEITIPEALLSGKFYTLSFDTERTTEKVGDTTYYYTTDTKTLYTQVGEANLLDLLGFMTDSTRTDLPPLAPLVFNIALLPVLGNGITTMLRDVSFYADGNIRASYAALPDSIAFMDLMTTTVERLDTDWQPSPQNLVSCYPIDDTTIGLIPHVDMIMRQIERNSQTPTRAGNVIGVIGGVIDLYALLNQWSTSGIKLIVKENPDKEYRFTKKLRKRVYYTRTLGDYIVYIDKSEVEALFAVLDIVRILLPEEIAERPLDELLAEWNVSLGDLGALSAMVNKMLHKMTLDAVIDRLKKDLEQDPLQIGIYLSREPVASAD